jgi:fused signal recognition particle receptor
MIFKFLKTSYDKISHALAKTGEAFGNKLRSLFSKGIDENTLEELEKLLYEADVGVQTAVDLTNHIRTLIREKGTLSGDQIVAALREQTLQMFAKEPPTLALPENGTPAVILIVGVNGSGKTTSVAKLAKRFQEEGKKPLVVAADTFRAAAVEQLNEWAGKLQVDIVKGAPKSDPAAVSFDGLQAAKARGADIVLIDTAGRLHTKTDLMHELEKIRRICVKIIPEAPHETLLVLDATTGQNAIDQAHTFHKFTPLTGIILTKLDGTSKGGIIINIQRQLGLPVKFIGVGEGADDLQPFSPETFVTSLFGEK